MSSRWRLWVPYLVMGIGLTGGIVRVESVASRACRGQNEIRTEVVKANDELLLRAQRAFQATLSSPLSTDRQKRVARENLDGIDELRSAQHDKLVQRDC